MRMREALGGFIIALFIVLIVGFSLAFLLIPTDRLDGCIVVKGEQGINGGGDGGDATICGEGLAVGGTGGGLDGCIIVRSENGKITTICGGSLVRGGGR